MADVAPQRRDDLLGDVRARREGLRAAMDHVEAAISEPAPGREDEWRAGVAEGLTRFRAALDAHVEVTESSGGLFDQVMDDAPRLAKRIERLRAEHETMAARRASIDRELGRRAAPEDVRESVLELLGMLARHRHRGADLLHEAFVVDISVGD